MGKRKERRLAALSNAGRRVKLDLSAEPSGDLGGSPGHNEVGGDQTQSAGLPNSPSSSGQQPQNPLLLLGQYSDDEVDEESNKRSNCAAEENAPADHDHQVQGPMGEGDMDANVPEDLPTQKVHQQDMEKTSLPDSAQNQKSSATGEGDASAAVDPCKEMGSVEPTSVTGTSDVQVVGDVNSGWKMVLHAESNQYYYWNVETGETSWEVPVVLSQSTELSTDEKNLVTSNTETASVGLTSAVELGNSSAALTEDGSINANLLSRHKEVGNNVVESDDRFEGDKSETLKDSDWTAVADHNESLSNSGAVNAVSTDGSLAGSQKYMNDVLANGEHKTATEISTQLAKQCESLLEKLKSLRGSKGDQQGDDWVQKHILEVEIRLSDIKSLLSYGSSMLPFWEHSERQLKRLETVINNEIYQLAVFAQMEDVATAPIFSSREKDQTLEGLGHESEADGNEHNIVSSSLGFSHVSASADTSAIVERDSKHKAAYEIVAYAEHVSSSASPSRHVGSDAVVSEQVDHTALPDGSVPKAGFNAAEDVDMDVDMEVEDAVPTGSTAIGDGISFSDFVTAEQPNQPIQSAEYSSLVSEYAVPPLPDEEWIPPPPPENDQVPPPPPDNELVPPPPPDEPPELSYPSHPSYMETGQPLTYAGQYNITYQDPNLQYYGPTEVQGSNFYGHVGVGQVALPQTSLYYEAVASTYGGTAPVIANAIETASYYGIQDGTVPPVPGCTSVESSQFHHEPGPVSYNTHASDQIASADVLKDGGPELKVDASVVGGGTEVASLGAPTSATIQAPATTSVKEDVSAPSINADTAASEIAASSLMAKVQSKVSRTKKRTVAVATSLRSNKKVSSLVDKWKAAKEELNEIEEEEPKNALEILEKKRQREIEEWKAQQIASGEAKDNANFQPLGGDWRERVKRRRAKAASEAATDVPAEAHTDVNQQPDLAEISKDLPSGWQAYWDCTSKQVYYGNTFTSETTWTRPTK